MLDGQFHRHCLSSGISRGRPDDGSLIYVEFIDAESPLCLINIAYTMDAFEPDIRLHLGLQEQVAPAAADDHA